MAGQTINNNRFFIQFSYVAKIPMLIIKSMGMANTIINSAFTIFFISPPALNDNLQGFTPVIDPTTGKIIGYKTAIGGADTVFPFSGTAKPLKILGAVSLNGINGNNSSYAASNAIDGNTETCYLCNSDSGLQIVFTLDSEYIIKEVRVLASNAGSGQSAVSTVNVFGSKDNSAFIKIASAICQNFSAASMKNVALSVIPVASDESYKFIKLTKDGAYTGFCEVEIMG